ncbi:MAG TPA: GNAT family N-acetyltransferase [Burkholderiales bacterium]|nr:GNAT family N-acetyltransferase [Burkholderiales bacterium]
MDAGELRIGPLREADIGRVCALAREIWLQHYPGIITVAQIEYMLGQRYTPEAIRAQLREGTAWWDTLQAGGELCGFASCEPGAEPGSMKLDKLYVHGRFRGMGCGRALIEHVAARARKMGMDTLYLQVNKHNHGSVAAYLRTGFHVARSVKVDIGRGFCMDDYVMSRALAP